MADLLKALFQFPKLLRQSTPAILRVNAANSSTDPMQAQNAIRNLVFVGKYSELCCIKE